MQIHERRRALEEQMRLVRPEEACRALCRQHGADDCRHRHAEDEGRYETIGATHFAQSREKDGRKAELREECLVGSTQDLHQSPSLDHGGLERQPIKAEGAINSDEPVVAQRQAEGLNAVGESAGRG
ncbi:hypothetical protein M2440_002536 [Methylorubrum extorquens]|nr:hypothetical protein [Methylorubrum extorquens]